MKFFLSIILILLDCNFNLNAQNRISSYNVKEKYDYFCKVEMDFDLAALNRFNTYYDSSGLIMSKSCDIPEHNLKPLQNEAYNKFYVRMTDGGYSYQLIHNPDQVDISHILILLEFQLEFQKINKEQVEITGVTRIDGIPLSCAINSSNAKTIAKILNVKPDYNYFIRSKWALYSADFPIVINKLLDDAKNEIGKHNFTLEQLEELRNFVNQNWD